MAFGWFKKRKKEKFLENSKAQSAEIEAKLKNLKERINALKIQVQDIKDEQIAKFISNNDLREELDAYSNAITQSKELTTEDKDRLLDLSFSLRDSLANFKYLLKQEQYRREEKVRDEGTQVLTWVEQELKKIPYTEPFRNISVVGKSIKEIKEVLSSLKKDLSKIEEIRKKSKLETLKHNRERILNKIESAKKRISELITKVENGLNEKEDFKKAIFKRDHETVRKLGANQGNVKLERNPPKVLIHGVHTIRPGYNGSWDSGREVYSVRDYVDIIEDILKRGLKASTRHHGPSNPDRPGLYFFDYNTKETGYGGVKIVLNTEEIEHPIFDGGSDAMASSNTQHIIFDPCLKANFRIELRFNESRNEREYMGHSESKVAKFYLEVKAELDRRGIPYTLHDSFHQFENAA